ncbi:four-carbon acid sugar kinase family protein [uncultured Celeribacter sp.]|uniref:four-carbon acid sugar kinase family protein n=1 Tax=uncultured Celeribacter sp. TaxID=1303376 RepID=UPI0037498F76
MKMEALIVADDLTGALDSAVGFAALGGRVVVARSPGAVPEALALAPDVLAVNTASREVAPDIAAARVMFALAGLHPGSFKTVMKKVDSRLKGNIAAETGVMVKWFDGARLVACPAIPEMGRCVETGMLVGEGVSAPLSVVACFETSVEVPDCESDADLDRIVCASKSTTLWVGARGLSFALARRSGVSAPAAAGLRAPLMIANGSRDPVTLAQIAALTSDVTVLDAPDGEVRDADVSDGPLVLSISDGGGGLSGHEAARRFAETVAHYAERRRPAALLVCGGESAQAILDRLGINSLQVTAELRPGLPLCEVRMPWGNMQIVTKSGGFGAPELLAELVKDML